LKYPDIMNFSDKKIHSGCEHRRRVLDFIGKKDGKY